MYEAENCFTDIGSCLIAPEFFQQRQNTSAEYESNNEAVQVERLFSDKPVSNFECRTVDH